MAELEKNTKVYPVHHQSPILEVTPLYTTILTEELNRIVHENLTLKLEAKNLRQMIRKMQLGEDPLTGVMDDGRNPDILQ